MTIKSIDNLDGTETLDELEAMLDAAETADNDSDNGDEEQGTDTPTETDVDTASSTADEDDGQGADADAAQGESEDDTAARGVASKDGKHIIPYEVLAAERAEAQRLKEELAQMRSAADERDKLQSLLKKHGIEHTADNPELSMEQIEQLAEDYPDVGGVLVGIARKLHAMEQAAAPPAANPVLDALDAVPDLKAWQDGDPDRFTFAITVDDKLKSDPAFADKPLAERFAEAARRTKAAFGDATEEKAPPPPAAKVKAEPEKEQDAIPNSPSSIGASNRHSVDGSAEQLAGLSHNELNARMASMTPAQIDALLSSVDY